tara:strand:- start:3071 stop:9292 length:6222 start_codon:yes stop_codon:yes gene_type:complete
MATPEEIQAVWTRATTRFPHLIEKWGAQLPADTSTINAALTDYNSQLSVGDPTLWSKDYWKNVGGNVLDFGQAIGRGIVEDFTKDMNPFYVAKQTDMFRKNIADVDPRFRERMGEPGEDGTYSPKQMLGAIGEGIAPLIEAYEDVIRPVSGGIVGSPIFAEPGIGERKELLEERGEGAPWFFGDLERNEAAYRAAHDAGEIEWWKAALGELTAEIALGGTASVGKQIFKKAGDIPPPSAIAPIVPEQAPLQIPMEQVSSVFPDASIPDFYHTLGTPNIPRDTMPLDQLGRPVQTRADWDTGVWERFGSGIDEQEFALPSFPPRPDPPPFREDFVSGGYQQALPLEYQQDILNPFGKPVEGMPGIDFMTRQADEPSYSWVETDPMPSLTSPSGKPRKPFRPMVTRKEEAATGQFFEPRIAIGKEIQDLSPFAKDIPENAQGLIDRLLAVRQKGVEFDTKNPGHRMWIKRWSDEVAQSIFGNKSQSSRNKVFEYIDTLPGQQEFTFTVPKFTWNKNIPEPTPTAAVVPEVPVVNRIVDAVADMSDSELGSLIDDIADEVFEILPVGTGKPVRYFPYWKVQGGYPNIPKEQRIIGSAGLKSGGYTTIEIAQGYPKKIVKEAIRGQQTRGFLRQESPENRVILDAINRIGKVDIKPTAIPTMEKPEARILGTASQATLTLDDFAGLQKHFFDQIQESQTTRVDNIWDEWRNTYMKLDEVNNELVPEIGVPLTPTKKNWHGVQYEAELSRFIDNRAPARGVLPAGTPGVPRWRVTTGKKSDVPSTPDSPPPPPDTPTLAPPDADFSKVSPWVQGLNQVEGYIFDQARKVWRNMAAPDEIASRDGIRAWVKGLVRKGGVEAPFKTIARLYEGTINSHADFATHVIRNGTRELEELGWIKEVDGNYVPTKEALGEAYEPGDLRLLYYALHDKKWLPNVEQMALRYGDKYDLVWKQYHNLRALTDMEQTLRANGGIKLKDFGELGTDTEQYFYRGFVPENLDWDDFHKRVTAHNNAQRIGRTQSIQFSRRAKIGKEEADIQQMMSMGLKPIRWNPYEQAMFSSKLGLKVRMETELLNILKDPSINQAEFILKSKNGLRTDEYERLKKDGWEEFVEGGPAFQGEKSYITPKLLGNHPKLMDEATGRINPQTATPERLEQVWMFHPETLKGMKQFFGDQNVIEKFAREKHKIPLVKKLTGLDPEVSIDNLIFIPKAIDLFGSLFQQVDFASRAIYSGPSTTLESSYYTLRDLTGGNIGLGQAVPELAQAFGHTLRVPKNVFDIGRAFVSKKYRDELFEMMLDNTEWFSDPALKGFNNQRSRQVGLNLQDNTLFIKSDDGIALTEEAVSELMKEQGWKVAPKKVAGLAKTLNNLFQEGLFEGVYPVAIYSDFRNNIIPMVMKANRYNDLTPDQIMGIAAKRANKNWSVIPESQSVIRGNTKSFLKRIMFSVNEQETFHRQMFGMFSGEDKAFWLSRNIGAMLSMYMMAEMIHRATTGEPLPKGRLLPIDIDTSRNRVGDLLGAVGVPEGIANRVYPFSYADQWLAPDIPVAGRDGDNVAMDMLNQYDTVFRTFDSKYQIPIIGSLGSRLGTTPSAIVTQIFGEDFRGRKIDQYGMPQRILQGVHDLGLPIGFGQLLTGLVVRSIGDKELPTLGSSKSPILAPGTTVADIFPTEESKLGGTALAIQGATGLNLKASSGKDLNDKMVINVRPKLLEKLGKEYNSWEDVQNDTELGGEAKLIILNAPENARVQNEKALRRQEGYETYYDDGAKWMYDVQEAGYKKKSKEDVIVEQYARDSLFSDDNVWFPVGTKKPWEPKAFRDSLSSINQQHNKTLELIDEKYKVNPLSGWVVSNLQEMPKRSEQPLKWASWHYNDIRKKHTDPVTGKTDWTKFDAEWEDLTSQWDDEEAKESGGLLARYTKYNQSRTFLNDNHNFLVQEYYVGLQQLDEAGYFQDGIKYDPETGQPVQDEFYHRLTLLDQGHSESLARLGMSASEVWDKYLSENTKTRALMRSSANSNFTIQAIVKTMELVRKNNRYSILMSGQGELDRIVIKWFENIPTHPVNGSYYQGLYGQPPSSFRQAPYR